MGEGEGAGTDEGTGGDELNDEEWLSAALAFTCECAKFSLWTGDVRTSSDCNVAACASP